MLRLKRIICQETECTDILSSGDRSWPDFFMTCSLVFNENPTGSFTTLAVQNQEISEFYVRMRGFLASEVVKGSVGKNVAAGDKVLTPQ